MKDLRNPGHPSILNPGHPGSKRMPSVLTHHNPVDQGSHKKCLRTESPNTKMPLLEAERHLTRKILSLPLSISFNRHMAQLLGDIRVPSICATTLSPASVCHHLAISICVTPPPYLPLPPFRQQLTQKSFSVNPFSRHPVRPTGKSLQLHIFLESSTLIFQCHETHKPLKDINMSLLSSISVTQI